MNDISLKIKALREKKGLSQKELASLLGITQSGYQALESGKNDVTWSRLNQVAEVFDMSIEELVAYPNKIETGTASQWLEHLEIKVKELESRVKELERLYIYERMRANRIMVNQAQDDLITAQSENLELQTIQDLKDRIIFYKKEVEKDERDLKNLGLNMFTINVAVDSPTTR